MNRNHCSIPTEKVFFLQVFARKQTFDRIFSLLETRISSFKLKADFPARRLQRDIVLYHRS